MERESSRGSSSSSSSGSSDGITEHCAPSRPLNASLTRTSLIDDLPITTSFWSPPLPPVAAAALAASAAQTAAAAAASPSPAVLATLATQRGDLSKIHEQLNRHRPLYDELFGAAGAHPPPLDPPAQYEMSVKLSAASIQYLKGAGWEISMARREFKNLIRFLYHQQPWMFILYHDQLIAAWIRCITPILELNRREAFAPINFRTGVRPKPIPPQC